VLTALIAQGCIMLGDLNAIAPVITMAFMITYGTLNLASFYESFTKNPSYRPRFRFRHWTLSLAGALASLQDRAWLEGVVAAVAAGRARIAEIAATNGLAALPSATNFVAVDCGRDGAFCEGYNPDIEFRRTQTLMGGASHCDFRYKMPDAE